MIYLSTERLNLRQWRASDYEPFAALNDDSRVMAHFPKLLTRAESDAGITSLTQHIDQYGYGFWAAERCDSGEFIGFIGLKTIAKGFPFTPCVEIGWRLAAEHWGRGFATEGARGALEYAFTNANLQEVISMTSTTNNASEWVMQKLGMRNSGNNFKHPDVERGHILEEHLLYTLTREQWLANQKI